MANANNEGLAGALSFTAEQAAKIEESKIVQVDGRDYTRVTLVPVHKPETKTLKLVTLTGLLDVLAANINSAREMSEKVFIHVCSPDEVKIQSHDFGPFRQRDIFAAASPSLERFQFDRFMLSEAFIIGLNALFTSDGDRDALAQDVASIKIEGGATIKDDGTSQTVTAEAGARLVATRKTKSRVMLAPFCTFAEVQQPLREFIFRLDASGQPGLFQADGGAWRSRAMLSIKNYLEAELAASKIEIPVIA